jgi:cell wall-associated NlpC family hydrolase
LEDVGESMGYQTVQRNGQYVLGGTDAAYTVAMNRKEALQGDQPVLLPDPPALVNGRPYVSSASLSQLTGMQVKWDNSRSQLVLTPPAAQAGGAGVGAGTGRAAVKSSPSGTGIGTGIGTGRAAVQSAPSGTGTVKSLDVGTPDPQAIIAYAQTFMGTPYQFSSGPYDQTRTFDCSSFMQYVYGHFGVMLPRSSIQQSQVGQTVQMTDLQPGDLMFFYTPGRYDNNQTVGHVGMYMGGNQIIQTYGAPGVTISDFNDYWRGRFLFGKRVL